MVLLSGCDAGSSAGVLPRSGAGPGWRFTVTRALKFDQLNGPSQRYRPAGVFLLLQFSAANDTDTTARIRARDVALMTPDAAAPLKLNGDVNEAAKRQVRRDYPGPWLGLTCNYGETTEGMAVFDVPVHAHQLALSFTQGNVTIPLGDLDGLP